MHRDELAHLTAFVAVAEERSFTRAAAELGTSQSTLSHTIKQLEARIGVRLLTRTTRSVAPTEAGERLYQSLAPRFEGIEADLSSLVAFRDKPAGTVRVTLSDHALRMIVCRSCSRGCATILICASSSTATTACATSWRSASTPAYGSAKVSTAT